MTKWIIKFFLLKTNILTIIIYVSVGGSVGLQRDKFSGLLTWMAGAWMPPILGVHYVSSLHLPPSVLLHPPT